MRLPVLLLAPIAVSLSACGGSPTSSTPPLQQPTEASFRVTNVETRLENRRTDTSGPVALTCGELWISYSFEELAGIGARIVRQETTVVEHDGGTQGDRTTEVGLAVPASGRAVVTTVWAFCGQPAVDFPAQLKVQFTIRDDRGNDLRLTNGAVLAMP